MLHISNQIAIHDEEVELSAIRAQGAGGQNVNKVSSAIHLRFDITRSSLPEYIKEKLLALKDRRVTKDGIIIIKAQRFRTQDKNREDALGRLASLIATEATIQKKRKKTKPTRSSQTKRLDSKTRRGRVKLTRSKVTD